MGSTVQKIILCLTRTCSLIAPGYHYYQYSLLLSISLKLFCAWLAGLADGGQHISRPLRQLQLRRLLLQVSTYPTKISVKTIILLLQAGLAARAHCRRWSCIDIANNITNQSQIITSSDLSTDMGAVELRNGAGQSAGVKIHEGPIMIFIALIFVRLITVVIQHWSIMVVIAVLCVTMIFLTAVEVAILAILGVYVQLLWRKYLCFSNKCESSCISTINERFCVKVLCQTMCLTHTVFVTRLNFPLREYWLKIFHYVATKKLLYHDPAG